LHTNADSEKRREEKSRGEYMSGTTAGNKRRPVSAKVEPEAMGVLIDFGVDVDSISPVPHALDGFEGEVGGLGASHIPLIMPPHTILSTPLRKNLPFVRGESEYIIVADDDGVYHIILIKDMVEG